MMPKLLTLLSLLLILPLMGFAQQSVDLDRYRWQNRLLLVFASSSSSADFQQQLQKLAREQSGLAERDMKIFRLSNDGAAAVNNPTIPKEEVQRLADVYDVDLNVFTVLLIGKDGGVKLRKSRPLDIQELFGTIDAMPMRQREMRQDK